MIGIVIGMNQANKGMLNMKGYQDSSFQSPFYVQEIEEGKVEATFMGNDVGAFNIDDKKEKLEEIKSYNIFSEAGKFLADTVTSITQFIYHLIHQLIK